MRRLARPLVVLALVWAAAAPAARTEEPWGTRIASLSFEGDAAPQTAAWSRLTDLKPGQTLTPAAVHSALRDLFATRQFLDLSVEASPGPDGARVVVRFVAAPRIRTFEVVGRKIPDKGSLREAIGLWPGALWPPDAAEPLTETIRSHLRARGHFEAVVSVVVTGDPGANAVDVRVAIDPGLAAVAAPPAFDGALGTFPESRLRKEARQKQGKPYGEARARGDAERFEVLLRQNGYGRAEVRWGGATFDARTLSVTPRYRIFVGRRTVLRVAGAPASDVRKHPESPWARL
jgi:outer membrane protein assembly factor BamA